MDYRDTSPRVTERPLPSTPNLDSYTEQSDDGFQASLLPAFRPHTNAEHNLSKNQVGSLRVNDNGGNSSSSNTNTFSVPIRGSSRSYNSSVQEVVSGLYSDNISERVGNVQYHPGSESAGHIEEINGTYASAQAEYNRVATSRSRASTNLSTRRSVRSTGDSDSLSSADSPLQSHTSTSQIRRREQERERTPEPVEVVVPPWQPDASVTICPICRTQFSFFIRKHHCRKCGRVVCNSCSPHRITIPYQYIVQPPSEGGTMSTTRRPTLNSTRSSSSVAVETLGGGERVRLCNPCVPDPNIAPPQAPTSQASQQASLNRSVSTASPPYPGPYRPTSAFDAAVANFPPRRSRQPSTLAAPNRTSRSNTSSRGVSSSNNLLRPDASESRSRSSTIGAPREALTVSQFLSTSNPSESRLNAQPAPRQQHYRSLIPPNNERPLPQPPQAPQPRIPEEDECWVCHRELPSRALENFETLRANHVEACIAEAMGQPSPSVPPTAPAPRISRSPRPFVGESSASAIIRTQPGPTANTPEARMAAREQAHAAVVLGHSQAPTSPVRRTGVFPYLATEKDCVDDAECTICLEEFEVGVEMGRLECFCRFHLKCIRGWFENRPGQCPVHQHGGGY